MKPTQHFPEADAIAEKSCMVDHGDFEALLKSIEHSWSRMPDGEQDFRMLRQAVAVAARRDPSAFSQRASASLIGFAAYLVLRSQFAANNILEQLDESSRPRINVYGLVEAERKLFDQMVELQTHLANLLQSQASTARMWSLVKQTAVPNETATEASVAGQQSSSRRESSRKITTRPVRRTQRTKVKAVFKLPNPLNGHAKPR